MHRRRSRRGPLTIEACQVFGGSWEKNGNESKVTKKIQQRQQLPASLNYINMEDGTWLWHQCPCFPMLSNAFHEPAAWSVRVARTHHGSGKGWGSGRLFPSWCWSWWTRTACLGHIFLGKSWEGIYDMNGGNGQIYLDTYMVLSLSLSLSLNIYHYITIDVYS